MNECSSTTPVKTFHSGTAPRNLKTVLMSRNWFRLHLDWCSKPLQVTHQLYLSTSYRLACSQHLFDFYMFLTVYFQFLNPASGVDHLNYCWMLLGDDGVWELTGAQRWWLIVDIAAVVADEKSSAASEPPAKRFKWVVLYIVESAVSDCDTKTLPFRTGLVAEHTWKKALSSGNWQTRVRLKTVIKMESGGICAFSTWFLAHWPGQLRRQSSWEY